MNEKTRDEINDFLDNTSTKSINNFISYLEKETINLSNPDGYELREILNDDDSVYDAKKICKKFQSTDALIITLKLLREIKKLKRNIINSTKSKESAFRSSTKEALGETSLSSTPSCSTTMAQTRSKVDGTRNTPKCNYYHFYFTLFLCSDISAPIVRSTPFTKLGEESLP